jgi:heat shock protein HslJ
MDLMKMRMFVKVGTGVALGLVAAACGSSSGSLTAPSTPPSVGAGAGASSQDHSGLLGSWQLVSLTETGQTPVNVKTPERFTATFGDDGRVSLLADCNRCAGGYTAKGDGLTVGPMACTRAYCESAPLDTQFAGLVSGATTWKANGAGLELRCDAGVLQFRR